MVELAVSVVQIIVDISKTIYQDVQEVKMFKMRSQTLAKRISTITCPVEVLLQELEAGTVAMQEDDYVDDKGAADSTLFMEPLQDLAECLKQAQTFIEKLKCLDSFDKWKEKSQIIEKFDHFNAQITALERSLTVCLQVKLKGLFTEEMKKQAVDTFDRFAVLKQNQEDLLEDLKELDKMSQMTSETNDIVRRLEKQLETMQAQISRRDATVESDADNLMIPFRELRDIEFLCFGSFCRIYTTTLGHEKKIIKEFDSRSKHTIQQLIRDEIEEWRHLRYSEFVVQLCGYSLNDEGKYCLILEYMSLGTLRTVLKEKDRHNLTWKRRINMALDCAQGLYTIHCGQRKTLVHSVVSSSRFLVNENYRVKIADNGLVKPSNRSKRTPASRWTQTEEVDYLCPEKIRDPHYKTTIKSEMYRLGTVLYEIASCMEPFESLQTDEDMLYTDKVAFIRDGNVEQPPADTPEGLKALILECRKLEPRERPTSGKVVQSLMSLLDVASLNA